MRSRWRRRRRPSDRRPGEAGPPAAAPPPAGRIASAASPPNQGPTSAPKSIGRPCGAGRSATSLPITCWLRVGRRAAIAAAFGVLAGAGIGVEVRVGERVGGHQVHRVVARRRNRRRRALRTAAAGMATSADQRHDRRDRAERDHPAPGVDRQAEPAVPGSARGQPRAGRVDARHPRSRSGQPRHEGVHSGIDSRLMRVRGHPGPRAGAARVGHVLDHQRDALAARSPARSRFSRWNAQSRVIRPRSLTWIANRGGRRRPGPRSRGAAAGRAARAAGAGHQVADEPVELGRRDRARLAGRRARSPRSSSFGDAAAAERRAGDHRRALAQPRLREPRLGVLEVGRRRRPTC